MKRDGEVQRKARIFWFTGLSGSGKTTLARQFEAYLIRRDFCVKVLDGDEIRKQIHHHLDFSRESIKTNNHWVVQYCVQEQSHFDFILVSLISPFKDIRSYARKILSPQFYEVYVKASLETCIKRDPKGLYQKALKGKIKNFIGLDVNVPYEAPDNPDFVLNSEESHPDECVAQLIHHVFQTSGDSIKE